MIEGRALIKDTEITKNRLVELGATFDSDYEFTDIIFVPKKEPYNLTDDFLRARVYTKNNWPTQKVVLIRKQTSFKDIGKIDNVVFKKEFPTKEQALSFIEKEFSSTFTYGFEYARIGYQYNIFGDRCFVEDIEKLGPSIEIETTTSKQLSSLFEKIDVTKVVSASLPETMRQLLIK